MKTHEFLAKTAMSVYSALIAISDMEAQVNPRDDAEIAWDCATALYNAAPSHVKAEMEKEDEQP